MGDIHQFQTNPSKTGDIFDDIFDFDDDDDDDDDVDDDDDDDYDDDILVSIPLLLAMPCHIPRLLIVHLIFSLPKSSVFFTHFGAP